MTTIYDDVTACKGVEVEMHGDMPDRLFVSNIAGVPGYPPASVPTAVICAPLRPGPGHAGTLDAARTGEPSPTYIASWQRVYVPHVTSAADVITVCESVGNGWRPYVAPPACKATAEARAMRQAAERGWQS